MLNNLECPALPELAEDCKKVLVNLGSSLPNIKFDIDLCEISCRHKDCIADFRWRAEPTPPEEYTRYKSLSPKDKIIFRDQNPDFFRKGRVYNYLEAKHVITNINKRNLSTLLMWFKLPAEVKADPESGVVAQEGITAGARLSVEKYINTYSGRMN